MLVLEPQALQLFVGVGNKINTAAAQVRLQVLTDYLNAFHPEWKEGLVITDDMLKSNDCAWYYIRMHLFKLGLKFKIENTRSYWFIHTQEAERGEFGNRELTELCYVSLFGDTFTGHAVEYFDPRRVDKVLTALVTRIGLEWTTKKSSHDNTVEAAIADQHEYTEG